MSSSQSNFDIENIVDRYTTFQKIFREYVHECRQEYTVSRALCINCVRRLEASRGFPHKMIPTECMCSDIPPYVSEQCVHCSAIKEEIVFLKNEIRRSCTTYGIEVAETLETNPLFSETIEKLVLRIEILEQVLLRQFIDTETAARNKQHQDDIDDVPDDVSELSEELAVDASEFETNENETEPEQTEYAKEEEEVTEESDQEEDDDEDETQVQSMNDDMDISTEDPGPCNNTTDTIKMTKGLLLKHIDFNKISGLSTVRQPIENSDARKFNYEPFAEIDATLHLNNGCPLSFNNEFTIFGDYYTYFDEASSHIHVTIPTPQPDPDTDTNDDEVASITRGIEQMNNADTMRSREGETRVESSSNEVDSVNSERENRKRPRPESPELWLYDGSMV